MDKELFARLYTDECFKHFCDQIDQLRKQEYEITLPLETTTLLFGSGIRYLKEDIHISSLHNSVKKFLDPTGREISKNTAFYDYFVIQNIMRIADNNTEQIEDNRYRLIPLNLTEYAISICGFDTCTCGYEPRILFSSFFGSLTGKVFCEKCGLSVCKLFTHQADIFHGDSGTVYVNLQEGTRKLSDLWNEEVAKNESILHRTMRELLSYGSNVCVNPIKCELHNKLYGYMVDKNIYRKPEYWNEPGYWDIATDKMMECPEPVQWVEDYLWENMPCRITA